MLATLLGSEKRATVQTLGHPAAGIIGWMGGGENPSGVHVDENTALSFSGVWAATRVISETIAGLPCFTYERIADDGKRRATEHNTFRLVHDEPNDEMSSFTLFETESAHLANWGNCYMEIGRTGPRASALYPLTPDHVRVERDRETKELVYWVMQSNRWEPRMADDILHVPGLGFDGVVGYSVINRAAASIGVSIAAQHYGGRFFAGDATPTGILTHPGRLSDPARGNLRSEWKRLHGGVDKSHNVAILQEGMKYEKIGIPPEEAQFLQTRRFGIEDVARWYRLPVTMLGDLTHGTHSNVEQESLNFVLFSVTSWLRRWESALNRKLLLTNEKGRFFIEFLVDGLLRGDTQTRFNAYAIARQWGWLSINDIRRLENMNPIPEGGDIYLSPLNMTDASQAGEQEQEPEPQNPTDEQDEEKQRARIRSELAPHFAEASKRADMVASQIGDFETKLKADLRENLESTVKAIRSQQESEIQSLRSDRQEIVKELRETESRIAVFFHSLTEIRNEYNAREEQRKRETTAAALQALEYVAGIMLGKEIEAVKRYAKQPERFIEQIDGFYEQHRGLLRKALAAPLKVYLVAAGDARDRDELAEQLAASHAAESKETLLQCTECSREELKQLPQRVDAAVSDWMDRRAKLNLGAA